MSKERIIAYVIFVVVACSMLAMLVIVYTRPAQGASCPYPKEMTWEEKQVFNLNNPWNRPHCFHFSGVVSCINTQDYREACPERFPAPAPYPGVTEQPPEPAPYPGIVDQLPSGKKLENVGKGGIPEPTATAMVLELSKPKRQSYNPFEAIKKYFEQLGIWRR